LQFFLKKRLKDKIKAKLKKLNFKNLLDDNSSITLNLRVLLFDQHLHPFSLFFF